MLNWAVEPTIAPMVVLVRRLLLLKGEFSSLLMARVDDVHQAYTAWSCLQALAWGLQRACSFTMLLSTSSMVAQFLHRLRSPQCRLCTVKAAAGMSVRLPGLLPYTLNSETALLLIAQHTVVRCVGWECANRPDIFRLAPKAAECRAPADAGP